MSSNEPQSSLNPAAQAKADKAYAKAMRPWYKKKRFILPSVLLAVIVISSASGGGSSDSNKSSESKPAVSSKPEKPIVVTVGKMLKELSDNALAAAKKYDGKRVTVSGKLDQIDAAGNWFELVPSGSEFSLENIRIEINDDQRDLLSSMKVGQFVTATGTVSRVDEFLGYWIDAESFRN